MTRRSLLSALVGVSLACAGGGGAFALGEGLWAIAGSDRANAAYGVTSPLGLRPEHVPVSAIRQVSTFAGEPR